MKVMIEIDLPDGQAIPDPRDIVRLTNPDWIASWWHISDIQDCATGWGEENEEDAITDEEAREILRLADKYHDCEEGLNWNVYQYWIEHIKQLRKEVA